MKAQKHLGRLLALVLALAALSIAGTASAGGGDGNGKSDAPGQAKKAEQAPAPQSEHGQQQAAEQHAEQSERKAEQAAKEDEQEQEHAASKASKGKAAKAAEKHGKQQERASKAASHASKPESKSKSYKTNSSGTNLDKEGQDHRHTICHATGSSSNPYVRITPSVSGVFHGHLGHQDGRDIVPPFTWKGQAMPGQNWDARGQAIFENGCELPAPPPAPAAVTTTTTTTEECPPTTKTETVTVVTGVLHATGKKNADGSRKYVLIHPSTNSAHYDHAKHEDDRVVSEQRTVTVTVPNGSCEQAAGTTASETTTSVATTTAITTQAAQAAVGQEQQQVEQEQQQTAQGGGVLGAQATLPAKAQAKPAQKPQGGVLGAVSRIGRAATSGTLPFTGLPLWVAALAGLALLGAGLGLRRGGSRI